MSRALMTMPNVPWPSSAICTLRNNVRVILLRFQISVVLQQALDAAPVHSALVRVTRVLCPALFACAEYVDPRQDNCAELTSLARRAAQGRPSASSQWHQHELMVGQFGAMV